MQSMGVFFDVLQNTIACCCPCFARPFRGSRRRRKHRHKTAIEGRGVPAEKEEDKRAHPSQSLCSFSTSSSSEWASVSGNLAQARARDVAVVRGPPHENDSEVDAYDIFSRRASEQRDHALEVK